MVDKATDERWKALMISARNGDKEAYNSLLTEISRVLQGFLRKRVSGGVEVEDVLQDILLAIHRKKHTYRSNMPFSSWLFAIARYKLIDHLRSNSRKDKKEFSDEFIEDRRIIEGPIGFEDREELAKALLTLNDRQRRIVSALKLEGKSVKEIAKEENMSEIHVKVMAHRGYRRLKRTLLRLRNEQ